MGNAAMGGGMCSHGACGHGLGVHRYSTAVQPHGAGPWVVGHVAVACGQGEWDEQLQLLGQGTQGTQLWGGRAGRVCSHGMHGHGHRGQEGAAGARVHSCNMQLQGTCPRSLGCMFWCACPWKVRSQGQGLRWRGQGVHSQVGWGMWPHGTWFGAHGYGMCGGARGTLPQGAVPCPLPSLPTQCLPLPAHCCGGHWLVVVAAECKLIPTSFLRGSRG